LFVGFLDRWQHSRIFPAAILTTGWGKPLEFCLRSDYAAASNPAKISASVKIAAGILGPRVREHEERAVIKAGARDDESSSAQGAVTSAGAKGIRRL